MIELNDRYGWYDKGASDETVFCMLHGKRLNLSVNPEKENNPALPDLIHDSGVLCELKTRRTPFFTAHKKYGVPVQRAVTINRNDVQRYLDRYPDMPIYFWVRWETLEWRGMKVAPMHGVWGIRVVDLCALCSPNNLHKYKGRVDDDQGNAKDSYVISLDSMTELFCCE